MVIGKGMIARQFASFAANERFIIFASGVSNSGTNAVPEFEREKLLLLQTIRQFPQSRLVYFSTCSIYDTSLQQSAYVQHKLVVENLIREHAKAYTIFRVSNPVGKTDNPHTILNYFIQHITQHQPFGLWKNAARNLIDIDDMYAVCAYILQADATSAIINVANPENYSVQQIVKAVEQHFTTPALYDLVDKGSSPAIDITTIQPIYREKEIVFENDYLKHLLNKYYPLHDFQAIPDKADH